MKICKHDRVGNQVDILISQYEEKLKILIH